MSLNMSLEEFTAKLPAAIVHKRYGHGVLRTLAYMNESCIACYSHDELQLTAVTFRDTWDEVYLDIRKFLLESDLL